MPRSSEIGRGAGLGLAKAQAELVNPEKSLTATIRGGRPGEGGAQLPLCAARKRARHRAQDAGPARDRNRADHRHRPGRRHGQSDHHAGACLRRMDRLGLAGLPDRRDGQSAAHGRGADLCAPLRAVHAGRALPARTISMRPISAMRPRTGVAVGNGAGRRSIAAPAGDMRLGLRLPRSRAMAAAAARASLRAVAARRRAIGCPARTGSWARSTALASADLRRLGA